MRRLRTPEDIRNLTGYTPKVYPEQTPLRRILDYYYIRPFEIRCALCGQEHMDGCIVELENESITNIGHICGARFGDRFGEEQRKFSESSRKPELIRKLADASEKLQKLHFPLQTLKHRLDRVARRRMNFAKMFPDLIAELTRRAANNQPRVFESIERTKDEVDNEMAANRFQDRDALQFKQVLRGTIQGYKFAGVDLSQENGARHLFAEADKFSALNIRSLNMQDLTKWSNWAADLDDAIKDVELAIADGELFFTPANFRLFEVLPTTLATRTKLKALKDTDLDHIHTVTPAVVPTAKTTTAKQASPRLHERLSGRALRKITGDKKCW